MKDCTSFGMRSIARHLNWVLPAALAVATTAVSLQAGATPVFARQTGQNCQACHAGGQFPELTPYGRMFKLTGFTAGQRTYLPVAVMAVFSANEQYRNQAVGSTAFSFSTASLFVGGKVTDNIGFLAQYTYNSSSAGSTNLIGPFNGQAGSDNTDFRYADHIITPSNDLVYGFSLNNNPGVQDVWNSSQAWGYGVVPGSPGVGNSIGTMLNGLGQQAVGAGAYLYWNKMVYAEVSGYRTGDGVFSFLTQGQQDALHGGAMNAISGTAPYVRLALTHEWGNSNAMVGYTYFAPNVYEGAMNNGPYDSYTDNQVDFQYQYLLDPHTFTFEAADIHETVSYGNSAAASDTNDLFRAKASYVYEAKYGAALQYFTGNNSVNAVNVANANGVGNTVQQGSSGWTPEVFWMPMQNVRVGYQYTMYTSMGDLTGATVADGALAKASDYNTSFLYVWAAF